MFTDINIYSINNKTDHISDKYIFFEKKYNKSCYFWIRSRIRSGSVISCNLFEDPEPDTDPYQNETDPQHCLKLSQRFHFKSAMNEK